MQKTRFAGGGVGIFFYIFKVRVQKQGVPASQRYEGGVE